MLSVTDFGAIGDGVTDDTAAIAAAITAANAAGARVFFPTRASGYALKSKSTVTLSRAVVIDFNGQRIIATNGQLKLQGLTVFGGRTLALPAARYATSVTLNNASGAQEGDLFLVNTSIAPSSDWADTKQDLVRIKSVSSNTLGLDEGLNFSYSTGDAGLECLVIRPVAVSLLNLSLDLVAADNDPTPYAPIYLYGLRDVRIVQPVLSGQLPFTRDANIYRTGILIYYTWGVSIESPTYCALSYPIGIYGGSRNISETNVHARYMHHSHADLGGWCAGYRLTGLFSSDSYQAISTHPCFNAHASDFDVRNDFGLFNWRVCGGSLRNGRVQTIIGNGAELPQFQNSTPASGYSYINEDADFLAENLTIVSPNRTDLAPFGIRYGRTVTLRGIKASSAAIGFNPGEVAHAILGDGNRFGVGEVPEPGDNLNLATTSRYDFASRLVGLVASAASLVLPRAYDTVAVSGTTGIASIGVTGHTGHQVTLVFTGALTVTDGSNLKLSGNFITAANSTLILICDGSNWYEISRRSN